MQAPNRRATSLDDRRAGKRLGRARRDPVDDWKRVVRERLHARGAAGGASLLRRIEISPWLVLTALAVGSVGGVRGVVTTLPLLCTVMLIQELPRAFLAQASAIPTRIVFSVIGSHTELTSARFRGGRAVVLAIVGSVANLVVSLIAFALLRYRVSASFGPLLESFALANVVWAGAQALPVRPFRLSEIITRRLRPEMRFALGAVTLVCVLRALVLAFSLPKDPLVLATLTCLLIAAGTSLNETNREIWDALHGVERTTLDAEARLSEGNPDSAVALASRGLTLARSPELRTRLWAALAWAGIGQADPLLAHAALLRVPRAEIGVHLLASYLACRNRVDEAVDLLAEARAAGHRSPETTKLLVDLLFRRGDQIAALMLARSDASLLSEDEQRAVASATRRRIGRAQTLP